MTGVDHCHDFHFPQQSIKKCLVIGMTRLVRLRLFEDKIFNFLNFEELQIGLGRNVCPYVCKPICMGALLPNFI